MLLPLKKMSACNPRSDAKSPVAVILSTVAAAVGGLSGLLVAFLKDDNGGGGGVTAWQATAPGFYVASAARQVLELGDGWRFHAGDDPQWSTAAWPDADWEAIDVDQPWEEEGHPDYDGFAWYRCHFTLPETPSAGSLYLRLGRIDDADEVWLNGTAIGRTGDLRAGGRTAWNVPRHYAVPRELLRPEGDNVIAVRVWDERLGGGLVDGDPALMVQDLPAPLLDLAGEWSLSPDDRPEYRIPKVDTSEFAAVVVPGNWDWQGREGFDGKLWYRVRFTAPADLRPSEELVLVMGAIDDEDETYLNGMLIGRTEATSPDDDVWQRERVYRFPASVLSAGPDANVLAVRVTDVRAGGGIVRGPVGLMTPTAWAEFRAGRDQAAHSWSRLWNWLLGRS